MTRALRNLVERQILKAQAEGQLDGLEGEGRPLPDRSGEAHLDMAEAVGHRIMAQAGALPQEVLLQREVSAARDALKAAPEEGRKAAMARLAELEMKLAIAQEARRKFLR